MAVQTQKKRKALVVVCHPDKRSFTHASAARVAETLDKMHWQVFYHDLYEEKFNPVLPLDELNRKFSFEEQVQNYGEELAEVQGLVCFHPDWWGGPLRC